LKLSVREASTDIEVAIVAAAVEDEDVAVVLVVGIAEEVECVVLVVVRRLALILRSCVAYSTLVQLYETTSIMR
jgi:hypothetical protein